MPVGSPNPSFSVDSRTEAAGRPWVRAARFILSFGGTADRLHPHPLATRPPAAVRYGLAILAVAVVALLRALLFTAFPTFFLFIPAVVIATLLLDSGAGLVSAAAATACVGFVFLDIEPIGSLSAAQWATTAVFAITNLGLVGLVAAPRSALLATTAARAELSRTAAAAAEREAFLASVLASSTDCIKVLDLDGRLGFMSEGGQKVMEVSDFNAVAGCAWPNFWSGGGQTQAAAAVAAARGGRSSSFVEKADTCKGTPKWWHVAVSPIMGGDGHPARILSVSRDITELRESEQERDRFVRLVENSTDFIGMAHIDGRAFFMNNAALRMVGVERADVAGLTIADFFPPEQMEMVTTRMLPTVDREGYWSGETTLRHFRTGELIPMLQTVFSVTDPDGQALGYGTVARDFRARKEAEEELRLLNGELAHRLKNVLAVVQSISRQTLRNASDLNSASEDLSARLVALGGATDILTSASWRSVDLRALMERTLAPHGELGQRILLDGSAVTLQPQAAVTLALALHELATNAAKYGALSNDTGRVEVEWRLGGDVAGPRFRLTWRERGGPSVTAPTRRGFGSTLIERSLRSTFGGSAVVEYLPQGLEFTLEVPMGNAIVLGGQA